MVSLTVIAQENEVRTALEGISFEKVVPLSPQTVELRMRTSQQEKLDQCVDRLRQAEIGIQEITRPRTTLERAFLDIIDQLGDEERPAGDNPQETIMLGVPNSTRELTD